MNVLDFDSYNIDPSMEKTIIGLAIIFIVATAYLVFVVYYEKEY